MSDPPSMSPPPSRAPVKRPVYLVVALLMVWVVGLFGATEGYQTIEMLRRPDGVRLEHSRIGDAASARQLETVIGTVLEFRKTVTPLAIAQLLLGTMLTLTAGLTLLGRGQARRYMLQAMVVYALFLPVDYLMRRPMRAVAIDSFAEGITFPPPPSGATAPPEVLDQRVFLWWAYRGALGLKLVILTAGVFAMTRPRVRAFFNAMAGERAREQEP